MRNGMNSASTVPLQRAIGRTTEGGEGEASGLAEVVVGAGTGEAVIAFYRRTYICKVSQEAQKERTP